MRNKPKTKNNKNEKTKVGEKNSENEIKENKCLIYLCLLNNVTVILI